MNVADPLEKNASWQEEESLYVGLPLRLGLGVPPPLPPPPRVPGGVMHLHRYPFWPAINAEELAEPLDGDDAVHEHSPKGARPRGGQQFGVRGSHGESGKDQPLRQPGDGLPSLPGDLLVAERVLLALTIVEVVEDFAVV